VGGPRGVQESERKREGRILTGETRSNHVGGRHRRAKERKATGEQNCGGKKYQGGGDVREEGLRWQGRAGLVECVRCSTERTDLLRGKPGRRIRKNWGTFH